MVIPATTGTQAHMLRKHPYKNSPNRRGIFSARVSTFSHKKGYGFPRRQDGGWGKACVWGYKAGILARNDCEDTQGCGCQAGMPGGGSGREA